MAQSLMNVIGVLLLLCIHHVLGQGYDSDFSYWYIIVPIAILLKIIFWGCWCYARSSHTRQRVVVVDRRRLCNPRNQDLPDALDVRPTQHGQVPPPPYVVRENVPPSAYPAPQTSASA